MNKSYQLVTLNSFLTCAQVALARYITNCEKQIFKRAMIYIRIYLHLKKNYLDLKLRKRKLHVEQYEISAKEAFFNVDYN